MRNKEELSIDVPVTGYVVDGMTYGDMPSNVVIKSYEYSADGTYAVAICAKKSPLVAVLVALLVVAIGIAGFAVVKGSKKELLTVSIPTTMYISNNMIETNMTYGSASNPLKVQFVTTTGMYLTEQVEIQPDSELAEVPLIVEYLNPGDIVTCNIELSVGSGLSKTEEVVDVTVINE